MKRGTMMAVMVIVIPAWLMIPLENRIHSERIRLKYGGAGVPKAVRPDITQGMAIALLAGFRGVVSDFMWIKAHDYFETKEWLRQYAAIKVATILQPQSTLYWDVGAWHMAWNIGYAVSVDPSNRTAAVGIKRQREWWDKARDFLEQGIENVPNRPDLYYAMGWLYSQKYKEPCKADEYYRKALMAPEPQATMALRMEGVERHEARAREECGDVVGAYQAWKRIWSEDHDRAVHPWSVVEREIRRLENVLNIPDQQRVFPIGASKPAPSP